MNRIILSLIIALIIGHESNSQENDSLLISKIYKNALTSFDSYNNLKYLCEKAPGRLVGSEASIVAVNYMKKILTTYKLDSVYLQKFNAPKWDCSTDPTLYTMNGRKKNKALTICALGPSVATAKDGLIAQVIEVKHLEELEKLGNNMIKGKIVFFNRRMDNKQFNTSKAYVDAFDQRLHGASEASKYGAAAVIVRSLTTSIDSFPHSGVVVYKDTIKEIPAVAISTRDAELLGNKLKIAPDLKVKLTVNCKQYKPAESYNVIGEIKGQKMPDEIILIGAHIDAWYNTPGAHDDGAGCVQVVDVLRIFRELNVQPKRTIRVILFMDEEMKQTGAEEYAALTEKMNYRHYVAIESDRGGHTPRGFSIDADSSVINNIIRFKKYLEPYKVSDFNKGYGGVDIKRLKKYNVPLIGFYPDGQRYFDYHHSANDSFDKVHQRELQLGTASIASLVYLIDKYGIDK
jgi:hypothetical protein